MNFPDGIRDGLHLYHVTPQICGLWAAEHKVIREIQYVK